VARVVVCAASRLFPMLVSPQYRYCRAATHSSTQGIVQDQLGYPTDQRYIPRPTEHRVIIALKRPVL